MRHGQEGERRKITGCLEMGDQDALYREVGGLGDPRPTLDPASPHLTHGSSIWLMLSERVG